MDHVVRRRGLCKLLASAVAGLVVLPGLHMFMLQTLLFWSAPPLDLSKALYTVNRPVAFTFLDAQGGDVGHRGAIFGKRLNLEEMPASLPAAFIAMDDRNLFSPGRFDPGGSLRARCVHWRPGPLATGAPTSPQHTR